MMERAQCSNAVARRAIAMILNAPPFSKAQSIIVADDILIFYILVFREKNRLGISCKSSAGQKIHILCESLFSLKIQILKEIKMSSAAVLINT